MCLIESADLNIIFICDKDTGNFNPNWTHLKFKDIVYGNDKKKSYVASGSTFPITQTQAHRDTDTHPSKNGEECVHSLSFTYVRISLLE